MAKTYDRAYFDRFYRAPTTRVRTPDVLQRKAAMALAAAEYALGRTVTSAVDVGCGEGDWGPVLKKMRPRLVYRGVDGSEYAVRRFGRKRGLTLGSFEAWPNALPDPAATWDLVICSDVLQYITDGPLEAGVRAMAEHAAGPIFLETYVKEDALEGDFEDWHWRAEAWYRERFDAWGLFQVGFHLWMPRRALPSFCRMEIPSQGK